MSRHFFAGLLAKQLHRLADQILAQEMADRGLTPAQAHILGYLVHHREELPCQKDVENCFGLSHPTVSGVLSRLEDKGFLEFLPDDADHRKKRLRATQKAIECDAGIHAAIDNMEARIVEGFSPEEEDQLMTLLGRGIRNLGGEPCRLPKKSNKEETT